MGETRAITATVHGRVQGVGFRYSTQRFAERLGLQGWVRNRPDGTVELHAQGPLDVVDRFSDWLQVGPPAARVTSVDVINATFNQALKGFQVRA